ncbi:unnamed protein product [Arabidopsis lyrata]|nr:unnamed protein product [Arabidopsis lyrata]
MSQNSSHDITSDVDQPDVCVDFADLGPGMVTMRVKVRIIRRFVCPAYGARFVEFVLEDPKGQKIHAVLGGDVAQRFSSILIEGNCIILSDFVVRMALGRFRPSSHRFRLGSNALTLVNLIRPFSQSDNFHFAKFSDIKEGHLNPCFCVDLIGRLLVTFDFRRSESNRVNHRFFFQMKDRSGVRLIFRLPDVFVDSFMNERKKWIGDFQILIVRFAKLEVVEGNVTATTACTCTQFFFDHECPEFLMARPRSSICVSDLIPSMNERMMGRFIIIRRFRCSSRLDTLELILADEKGDRIQASIGLDCLAYDSSRLVEGTWIFIKDFGLVDAVGSVRPTRHAYKILWNLSTSFQRTVVTASVDYFKFVRFEDVLAGLVDPSVCVDLIGRLMCVGNYDEDEGMNSTWEQIYLELENVRGIRIRCRLPKGYATKFFSGLKTCADNIILCVMRFARLELSRGDMRATTLCTCTELLFNPSCDEASRMRLAFASGSMIEAKINSELITEYDSEFKDGDWISLHHFELDLVTGDMRTTRHAYRINFLPSTILNLIPDKDDLHYTLYPSSFLDVLDDKLIRTYLINLIGYVVDIEDIKYSDPSKRSAGYAMTSFKIKDANNYVLPCVAIGDLAEHFHDEWKRTRSSRVVCVLRWWGVYKVSGHMVIQSVGRCSRLDLDPDMPEVADFRVKSSASTGSSRYRA